MIQTLVRLIGLPLLCLALAGCYLPVRFDAEIELSRYGSYTLFFDGYMTRLKLYDDLRKGNLSPSEELEAIEAVKTDLTRDPATKTFEYIRNGFFRLAWENSGDLFQTRHVTFLRRNERILEMRYIKEEAQVLIESKYIPPNDQKRLLDMGLNTEGELRVLTDSRVTEHNAGRVIDWPDKPNYKMYIWKVENVTSPSLRMKIAVR